MPHFKYYRERSNLGCTDTPFLALCQCRTPERIQLVGFRCPANVLFFFSFFLFLRQVPTRLWRVQHANSEEKKEEEENHRFWVWEVILRNPPLKFSTHPPSDLCRYPLSLARARSGWSASSIDVEWRRALSLLVISLSLSAWTTGPTSSFFFFGY